MSKCKVFGIDHGLKEVVADGLYMKTMIGETMSVAVIKFVEAAGRELPAKPHSHGEEASLQVRGACSIYEVHPDGTEVEQTMHPGEGMIIPANLSHYGVNKFEGAGMSMRLNVVTPPRAEYRSDDEAPYYPLASRGEK
ncbi:cupin [Caballeronia sp. GAFFF3]|uniref:cupin n=1 Tax=Caballeronia sp. GAFFF3 TaxID=2921759 RepID=UPI002028BDF9|nr:cupin [Caballeronia sp. GAFFF3]